MKDLIISNPEWLEKTKQLILSQGKENIHVIADFDRTLTKAFVDGKKSFLSPQSCVKVVI